MQIREDNVFKTKRKRFFLFFLDSTYNGGLAFQVNTYKNRRRIEIRLRHFLLQHSIHLKMNKRKEKIQVVSSFFGLTGGRNGSHPLNSKRRPVNEDK